MSATLLRKARRINAAHAAVDTSEIKLPPMDAYTADELAWARKIATAAIERYGDMDAAVMHQFRTQGIWNDHCAVQAALAGLRFGAIMQAVQQPDMSMQAIND